MRSRYWSCSRFADWIRGTAKLDVGTSEEWDNWRTTAQMRHNFRYWLAEEGLDYAQKAVCFVPDTLHSIKYYINNRWITRTHALTADRRDIKPGEWRDVGNRFLPCLFNELVDFVEVELAWWHIAWAEPADRAKYNAPFWSSGWWRVRVWRCREAGMDSLNWQAQLRHDEDYCIDEPYYGQFTPQAVKAQEIIDLYIWWTRTYRNRPEPMEASGWSAHCDAMHAKYGAGISAWNKETEQEQADSKRVRDIMEKMETAYEAEDEEMMIRLIKVRHGLWT